VAEAGWDRLLDWLHVFRERAVLAWPLVLGNLVAVYYGWTVYYAGQLEVTPRVWWPFVPDSPNAVLSFAVVLTLSQAKARSRFLDLLAWALNIKVGLWTVFVLLYYFEKFFADEPGLRWLLFWLHVGMIGQAFVLHRELKRASPTRIHFAILGAILFFSDWVDYGPLNLHPYLRTRSGADYDPIVVLVTVALSVLVLVGSMTLYKPTRTESRA